MRKPQLGVGEMSSVEAKALIWSTNLLMVIGSKRKYCGDMKHYLIVVKGGVERM